MRSGLVGTALLLALIILPGADPALGQCAYSGGAVVLNADIQLVGDTVFGTIAVEGNAGVPRGCTGCCGVWNDWGVASMVIIPNVAGIWGTGWNTICQQLVCGSPSSITSPFSYLLTAPGRYTFGWMVGGSWLYSKTITFPGENFDAPTCQTCVSDSSTACVHPFPRSMVISSRPDLTLSSPLGDRTIERTYRTSLLEGASAVDGMFGKGWRANFEYRIAPKSLQSGFTYGVMLYGATGEKTFYAETDGVYYSPDGKGGVISKIVDGYLWNDAQGTTYTFDINGSIQSIMDIRGNEERFDYEGERIVSLTDRHGRVVAFDYQDTNNVITNHVTRLLGPSIPANPDGVYATYSYDASGNLVGVTYLDGNAVSYGYQNSSWPNHMTQYSLSGPRGPDFQQLFQYDAQGRVLAVSEGPEGKSYTLDYGSELVDYDPAHPVMGKKTLYHTTVTEGTAQRTYYYESHGGANVLTKIEGGCSSCAAEKNYDAAFHVVQSKDNNGGTSEMTYDDAGRITKLTEAAGTAEERVTEYEYTYAPTPVFPGQLKSKTTRRQSVSSSDGKKLTTEEYDPATGAVLIRREQGYRLDGSALTAETEYTYNVPDFQDGLPCTKDTIDGPLPGPIDKVTYVYYPSGATANAGMLWMIIEPNGAVMTFDQYDALGNLLQSTDANNHVTVFARDSRGLLQAKTTIEGTTRYEYDAQGNITKTTFPKGNSVSVSHGQSGPTRIVDATGHIDFGYANGNMTSESVYGTDAVLHKSTLYDYDENGRLLRTRQASDDFEEFLYDGNGNVTARKLYAAASTVPFKTTLQGYDHLNRLKTVSVVGDPYVVSYDYDVQGNLSTVTDPVGQITRYFYDDLGGQNEVVSPETGTTVFTRDEAGNMKTRTDNQNRLISYAYDGLNRLMDITYPDATVSVHYRYDNYSAGSYPDAMGRFTEVADASGFRRLFYHPSGRLRKVVHATDARAFTTEYGYDSNGNLTSLTYPSGRTIQYAYDADSDRVQSVTSLKNGVTTVLAHGITNKPFGPINGFDYRNGAHLAKGYESLMYRLDSLAVTGLGGNPVPTRSYDYNPAGNISGITRDLPGGAEPHVFGYDLMDRLSSWSKPGRTQALSYDANGNRKSLSDSDNGLSTSYAYDFVAKNILESNSNGAESLFYGVDPLGNITGWGSKSLLYDINGRLGLVEDGVTALGEFLYNIDGQRARKTVAGQDSFFQYDMGGRLIHEYRPHDNYYLDYVYLGNEPLAMFTGNDMNRQASWDISLNTNSIAENLAAGALVGTLATSSPDPSATFSYTMEPGNLDNDSFQIMGSSLQSAVSFDYEERNSYKILVRSTAQDGLYGEKVFTIVVRDVNEYPPTLDTILNVTINEDTALQYVSLKGITAGWKEIQPLTVTATSTNPGLILNPSVNYTSPNAIGVLSFIPAANANGSSMITVTVNDGQSSNNTLTKTFMVTVTPVNDSPTDIALSGTSLPENQAVGTTVGILSTTDVDLGDNFTYYLVGGAGSENNDKFRVEGTALRTAANLDYETKHDFSIRIKSMDRDGLSFEKVFIIYITDLNDAPTDIVFSGTVLFEKQPAGTMAGSLVSVDQDANQTFTYTLVSGGGDNASFRIAGNVLQTNAVLFAAIKSAYTIRVRTTDQGGLFYEKVFTITLKPTIDILFQNSTVWGLYVWYMDGVNQLRGSYLLPESINPAWQIVGISDFNNDGKKDILFQESTAGWLYVWYMNGVNQIGGNYLSTNSIAPPWRVVGIADFNNDGKKDILFQELTGGWLYVWYMDGVNKLGGSYLSPNSVASPWRVVGIADFNNDGKKDILFQESTAGWLYVWYMDGVNKIGGAYLSPNSVAPPWLVVGIADFNNDGKKDILFQESTVGWLYVWYMNGVTNTGGAYLTPNQVAPAWRIVGIDLPD